MTSKGALIFAYNTEFDYVKIAVTAAQLVEKHLGIPVTLVTDNITVVPPGVFDQIIVATAAGQKREFKFGAEVVLTDWMNQNRFDAYTLSPYDQTLLIDADYFVLSDVLKPIFKTNIEFACYNDAYDITNEGRLNSAKRLSEISIPMQWATVVYFTKNEFAKSVFEFMAHIKQNYKYYAQLYSFRSYVYRNDYALSIALQALSGYNTSLFNRLLGKLLSVDTSINILDIRGNDIIYQTGNKVSKISGADLHIMNKQDLLSDNLREKLLNA